MKQRRRRRKEEEEKKKEKKENCRGQDRTGRHQRLDIVLANLKKQAISKAIKSIAILCSIFLHSKML